EDAYGIALAGTYDQLVPDALVSSLVSPPMRAAKKAIRGLGFYGDLEARSAAHPREVLKIGRAPPHRVRYAQLKSLPEEAHRIEDRGLAGRIRAHQQVEPLDRLAHIPQ